MPPIKRTDFEKQFSEATVVKITSPSNEKINEIISYLKQKYSVTPTSVKMLNEQTLQFFQFLQIEKITA